MPLTPAEAIAAARAGNRSALGLPTPAAPTLQVVPQPDQDQEDAGALAAPAAPQLGAAPAPPGPAAPPPVQGPAELNPELAIAEARSRAKREQDLLAGFQAWKATQSELTAERGIDVALVARETGRPFDYVAEHLDELKKQLSQERLKAAILDSPSLQKLMQDPASAAVVKDKLDDLSTWEWLFGRWEDVPAKPWRPMGGGGRPTVELAEAPGWAQAARGGWAESVEIPALAAKIMAGQGTPEDEAELERLEKTWGGRTYGAHNPASRALVGAPKMVPYIVGSALSRLAGGAAGAAVGGGGGAAAGAPAAGVGAVPGAAAGGVSGAVVGQYVGGAAFDFYQNVGPLYLQLRRLRDADGNPLLDDDAAKGYAVATSAGLSLFTAGIGGKVAQSIPWLKDVLERQAMRATTEAFVKHGGAEAAKAAGIQYGKHVASGALLMATQAAGNAATVELAKSQHGVEADWGSVREAAKQGALAGLQDMLLIAAWTPGREYLHQIGLTGAIEAEGKRYEALVEQTEKSKLLEHAETGDKVLGQVALDQGAPAVLADPVAWDRYWLAKKINPGEVAAEVAGDGGEQYRRAKAGLEVDLAFPIARWASRFKGTEHLLGLKGDVKLSGETRTPNQHLAWVEQLTRLQQAAKDVGADERQVELDAIEHAKYQEVLSAKPDLGDDHARSVAKVFREAVDFFATKAKLTPAQVAQEFPLPIHAPKGPEAAPRPAPARPAEAPRAAPEAARAAPAPEGVAEAQPKADRPAERRAAPRGPLPDDTRALILAVYRGDKRAMAELARRARAGAEAEATAKKDTLTGAGSRQAYEAALAEGRGGLWAQHDLNHLTQINARLGHPGGDVALRETARVLGDLAKKHGGELFRWGGDELATWLPTEEAARAWEGDVGQAFADLPEVVSGGRKHKVSVSSGFGATPEAADVALYRAKDEAAAAGRGGSLEKTNLRLEEIAQELKGEPADRAALEAERAKLEAKKAKIEQGMKAPDFTRHAFTAWEAMEGVQPASPRAAPPAREPAAAAAAAFSFLRTGKAGPELADLARAFKEAAAAEGKGQAGVPRELRKQLEGVQREIRKLEIARSKDESTGESRESAAYFAKEKHKDPVKAPSRARRVHLVVTPDEEGSATWSVLGAEEPAAGAKVRPVALPEWLGAEDFLQNRAAWEWVWSALEAGPEAPEQAQKAVAAYMRRAFDDFPPNEWALFQGRAVARLLAGKGGRSHAKLLEKLEAWMREPEGVRTEDPLPIPEATWGALIDFTRKNTKYVSTSRHINKKRVDTLTQWFAATQAELDPNRPTYAERPPKFYGRPISVEEARRAEAAPTDPRAAKIAELRAKAVELEAQAREARIAAAPARPRLDAQAVVELVGADALTAFRGLLAEEGGIHPDELARRLGMPSGLELLSAMAAAHREKTGEVGLAALNQGAVVLGQGDAPPERGPVWHSTVERAIAELPLKGEKATPAEWLQKLRKAPGVKGEELELLGLPRILGLEGDKTPWTRKELLEAVQASRIVVRERILGEHPDLEADPIGRQLLSEARSVLEAAGWRIAYQERGPVPIFWGPEGQGSATDWRVGDAGGKAPPELQAAMDRLENLATGEDERIVVVTGRPLSPGPDQHRWIAADAIARVKDRGVGTPGPIYLEKEARDFLERELGTARSHSPEGGEFFKVEHHPNAPEGRGWYVRDQRDRQAQSTLYGPRGGWGLMEPGFATEAEARAELESMTADYAGRAKAVEAALFELAKLTPEEIASVQRWAPPRAEPTKYESYVVRNHKPGSYREILLYRPGPVRPASAGDAYRAPHWTDEGRNVDLMAHARVSEHELADGQRVLLIEEIQSDLHQAGREHGYRDFDKLPELRKVLQERRAEFRRFAEAVAVREGIFKEGQSHEGRVSRLARWEAAAERGDFEDLAPSLQGKEAEALKAANREYHGSGNEVADTPWKEGWEELVVKRVVRYAAEAGYDQVALTPGEVHARRWGSELVAWEKAPAGPRLTVKAQVGPRQIRELIAARLLEHADLEDTPLTPSAYRRRSKAIEGAITEGELLKQIADAATGNAAEYGNHMSPESAALVKRGMAAALQKLAERSGIKVDDLLEDGGEPETLWRVTVKQQHKGEVGGMNLEDAAVARGLVKAGSPTVVANLEEFQQLIRGQIERDHWNDAKVKKVAEKLWARMQTEEAGATMPRAEGFALAYDKRIRSALERVVKKYGGTVEAEGGQLNAAPRIEQKASVVDVERGFQVRVNGRLLPTVFETRLEALNEARDRSSIRARQPVHLVKLPQETRTRILAEGLPLFQDGRGKVTFRVPGSPSEGATLDLALLANADQSTAAHEIGHWMGIVMGQLAGRAGADPEIVGLYRTALDSMGYKDHDERIRALLELQELARRETAGETLSAGDLARRKELGAREEILSHQFELYLAEGKAPTLELGRTFSRFKLWMVRIYKGLAGVKETYRRDYGRELELSDDVRRMFDRVLGAEDAVRQAERAAEGAELEAAVRAAFDPPDAEEVLRQAAEAGRDARERLYRALVAEDARERQVFMANERERLAEEVGKELDQDRGYVVQRFLREGAMPEGKALPPELVTDAGEPRMLEREELVQRYGADFVNANLRGMTTRDLEKAVPADVMAEAFQFASGDELVQALAKLPARAEVLRAKVQERLEKLYGPALLENPQALAAEALDAAHNEAKARSVLTGMRLLARKLMPELETRYRAIDLSDMKQRALEFQLEKPLAEVSPAKTLQAELAAAKRGAELLAKAAATRDEAARRQLAGEAFDAFEIQLFNHYLWRAAKEVREQADKDVGALRRATSPRTEALLEKAGADYAQRVRDLVDAVELRKSASMAEVGRRREINEAAAGNPQAAAAMLAWIEKQKALNRDPFVPDRVLDLLSKTRHWKELSATELSELRSSVDSIVHLAKLKDTLLTTQGRRERKRIIGELSQRLFESFGDNKIIVDRNTLSFKKRALRAVKRLKAGVIRPEEFFREADGGELDGPFTRYLWNTVSDAAHRWFDLAERVAKPVLAELEKMPLEDKLRWRNLRFTVKGQPYTMEAAMAVALNWGNGSNRHKTVLGWQYGGLEKFGLQAWDGPQTAQEFLRHLTARDWLLVQRIWDQLESLWPEMEQLERRMTGLVPPKVKREPFTVTTSDGQTLELQGGYYPMVYDRRFSHAGAAQGEKADLGSFQLFQPGAERAITPHGHLNARLEDFARPVELSLVGLYRHLNHATKDVAMREALISAYEIITDSQFRAAVQRTAGEEVLPLLDKWVRDTANDLVIPDGGEGQWVQFNTMARAGLTGSVFAFNAAQALQNLTGVANAADRVDARYLWRGIERVASERGAAVAFVKEKSAEMRHRARNIDRDLAAEMQRTLGKKGGMARTKEVAMWAFQASDAVTAYAVWLGAYHQALEGKVPGVKASDAQAVRWADQTVRLSLTAGMTKDLPALMRSPHAKWFTLFAGWANSRLNRLIAASSDAKQEWSDQRKAKALRRLTRITFWFLAGAVLSDLAVGKGATDDDEDGQISGADWARWTARRAALAPLSVIPLFGQVARAVADGRRDVSLAPIERVYSSAAQGISSAGSAASKWLAGDEEWMGEAMAFGQSAAETAAMSTGLPVSQVKATLGYWLDPDRDSSDTVGEAALGTTFGKKRRGSLSAAIYQE